MKYDFPVTKNPNPGKKPESKGLRFGTVFTDHMFIMDYNPQDGWNNGRIVPYGPVALDPAAVVLHYGQEMFEGLKAYKTPEGRVQLPSRLWSKLIRTGFRRVKALPFTSDLSSSQTSRSSALDAPILTNS